MFSPEHFRVLALASGSLVHSKCALYVVWGRSQTPLFCLGLSHCLHIPHWKGDSSPIEWSWHPCQNHLARNVRFSSWALSSVPLMRVSIFRPVPHCLDYSSFRISFEIGRVSPPISLFFKMVWLSGLLNSRMYFRVSLSIAARKPAGISVSYRYQWWKVFQSMDMKYLSAYLGLLYSLSIMFYSFQCTSLVRLGLNLSSSILLFLMLL